VGIGVQATQRRFRATLSSEGACELDIPCRTRLVRRGHARLLAAHRDGASPGPLTPPLAHGAFSRGFQNAFEPSRPATFSRMTLAVIHTRALVGLHAPEVVVEVHLANGLPSFTLVGLADTEVKEARVSAQILGAR